MKTTSKSIIALLAAGALGFGLSSQQAHAITLNFSSDLGASMSFNGTNDTFVFNTAPSGRDIMITLVQNGFNDSLGLLGNIFGTYTIGAITTDGSMQSAPVTSVGGAISIFDGSTFLTGDVAWIEIFTEGNTGGINAGGAINVTNFSYGGSNSDLMTLASLGAGSGTVALSFQFVPARSLTELTADGEIITTSYSGSITSSASSAVPDGGSTLALLGGALFGAVGLRRKFMKA